MLSIYVILILFYFLFGTLILFLNEKKFERHFIFFLIRTKYFLRVINKIANLSKKLWKIFADCAIIFSFSGIGARYLSEYRNKSKNLDILLIFIGILTAILFLSKISFLLILIILPLAKILNNVKNKNADFIVFSILISIIWFKILGSGIFVTILDTRALLLISLIAGIFGIPGLVILSFIYQGYLILFQNLNVPGVSPFIPAEKGGEVGLEAPGTGVFIPIWYALLGIIVTIIFHEFAHGILARVHDIKLKSTGILTFGAIPIGAFVEPDEEELNKRESLERTRVFAVGSFANFLVAIFTFTSLLFSPLLLGSYVGDGILVLETQKGYPADGVLKGNMIIYEVNSIPTKSVEKFKEVMSEIKPGETINLKTNTGNISLKTVENPEKKGEAYIGILLMQHIPNFIHESLFWIFFINLSISLVNLLPIIPLDGGRMLKEFILNFKIKKKIKMRIMYAIITAILILVIVNVFPLFRMLVNFIFETLGKF